MAAGAHVGGKNDVLARRAAHLVDAIDELFAVVDPLDGSDGFASHDRQEAVNVHAECEPVRPALGTAVADQPFEPRLVEQSHARAG